EPKEAGTTIVQALSALNDHPAAIRRLAPGLSAGPGLPETAEAYRQVALAIAPMMARTENPKDLEHLIETLAPATPRLGSKEAAEVAAILLRAASDRKAEAAISVLSLKGPLEQVAEILLRAASLVAAHMEPKEAVALLSLILSKTRFPLDDGTITQLID